MRREKDQQEKVAIIGDLLMGAAKGLGLHLGANAGIIGREAAAHSSIRPGILGVKRPTILNDSAAFKHLQDARKAISSPVVDGVPALNAPNYTEAKKALGLGTGKTEPLNIVGGKGSATPSGFFGGIGSRIQTADGKAVQRGMVDVLAGKPRSFGSAVKKNLVATELGVPEDIGRIAGEQLRGKTPYQQKRLLKRVRKAIAVNPEFREQPQVEPVFKAVNNILTEGVENLPIKDQWKLLGGVDRTKYYEPVLTAAQIAPVAAIPFDPTGVAASLAAKHMGINRLRVGLSQTESGKKFLEAASKKGIERGARGITSSEYLSDSDRARDFLTDTIISPAVRDPQKVLTSVGNISRVDPRAGNRLGSAMDDLMTGGKVRRHVSKELQAFRDLPNEEKVRRLTEGRSSLTPSQRNMALLELYSIPAESRQKLLYEVARRTNTPMDTVLTAVSRHPSLNVQSGAAAGVGSAVGMKGV